MTVQEAKESIEYLKMQLTEDLEMICFTGDELKALDMSIQALEEVEQYRALGTPKEIKIREVSSAQLGKAYLSNLTELREYQSLGTVEELKEAREKKVAKKLKIQKTDDKALFKCPCCDNVLLEEFYGVVTLRHGQIPKHCENCGQAINKSEME